MVISDITRLRFKVTPQAAKFEKTSVALIPAAPAAPFPFPDSSFGLAGSHPTLA